MCGNCKHLSVVSTASFLRNGAVGFRTACGIAVKNVILRDALNSLSSVLFAAPCRVCEEPLLKLSRIPICEKCLASLQRIEEPMCQVCGRPIVSPVVAATGLVLCRLCRAEFFTFKRARSYAVYSDVAVSAIQLLKYEEVTPLGEFFGKKLAEMALRDPEGFAADVVVPVPLHADRWRERGYNQAELIARPVARRLRLVLGSYLLVRKLPRPPKLLLTRAERWKSVRGAYAIREGVRVDNQRVLLVDDVMTTGATLEACARALKKAGAAEVVALTVARVVPRWQQPESDKPEAA